jgi:hypothetical protein
VHERPERPAIDGLTCICNRAQSKVKVVEVVQLDHYLGQKGESVTYLCAMNTLVLVPSIRVSLMFFINSVSVYTSRADV